MKQLQIALHYQDGTHKTVTTYETAAKVVRQEAKAAPRENLWLPDLTQALRMKK